ncbi:MAG: hypothetical protein E7429_05495 [Ruminococcaceae bacterium]|nr:hypothetical protein [Oscillospiraceae bacterium]
MKKKLLALALCLLLLLPAAVPPVTASSDVYFVATEQIVLPLTEDTMPFWDKNALYISSSIFTGLAREATGISRAANAENTLVVLYGGGKALIFDLTKAYAQDIEETIYYPGAVKKNGNIYVPASLVARYFGLKYSITGAAHGFLVWMRSEDMVLTDRQFARAATGPMNTRYEAYLKELAAKKEEEQPPVVTPPDPPPVVTPPDPPPVVKPEKPAEITGEQVSLCIEAGADTESLLDVLDGYGVQAAFFCTESFIAQQGALLRRMTAAGHSIGLLADGADAARTVAEQAEAANDALARATMGKTRLAAVKNGAAADRSALEQMGLRCLSADVDISAGGLKTVASAESLLRRVAGRDRDSTVWLGAEVTAVGLRAFLSGAGQAGLGGCPAWTETT